MVGLPVIHTNSSTSQQRRPKSWRGLLITDAFPLVRRHQINENRVQSVRENSVTLRNTMRRLLSSMSVCLYSLLLLLMLWLCSMSTPPYVSSLPYQRLSQHATTKIHVTKQHQQRQHQRSSPPQQSATIFRIWKCHATAPLPCTSSSAPSTRTTLSGTSQCIELLHPRTTHSSSRFTVVAWRQTWRCRCCETVSVLLFTAAQCITANQWRGRIEDWQKRQCFYNNKRKVEVEGG